MSLVLVAILSLALSGCGRSEIDTVKATAVPQDATHTYDTALSNRSSCKKDEWHSFKDETNRTVVEYRCELKSGAALLAAFRQQKIADTQRDFQGFYHGLDQTTEQASHNPEAAEKELADAQSKLAQLQSQTDTAKSNATASGDPGALRQAMVNQDDVAAAQRAVEQAQQHLDDAKTTLTGLPQERARFEQQEKDALAQIEKTYGGVTRASEVFQWHVRDNEVVPAWVGVELTKQDGSTVRQDRGWQQTLRDLLNHRGDDHVHAVLNVPDNIAAGQQPSAS
ncbi:hypothetical protein LMG9964_04687 [Paraburkholderia phenoliruptrix]|uniref:Uncharacterized protein n=2 Tax=Paraburkholderia phenoliruptrix TaxID=252970 RepID=A0A6J5KA63_9BURK|nr:hypothetical protein LMG9964_04687 [Paraburkholderia phenoliruptrix]